MTAGRSSISTHALCSLSVDDCKEGPSVTFAVRNHNRRIRDSVKGAMQGACKERNQEKEAQKEEEREAARKRSREILENSGLTKEVSKMTEVECLLTHNRNRHSFEKESDSRSSPWNKSKPQPVVTTSDIIEKWIIDIGTTITNMQRTTSEKESWSKKTGLTEVQQKLGRKHPAEGIFDRNAARKMKEYIHSCLH